MPLPPILPPNQTSPVPFLVELTSYALFTLQVANWGLPLAALADMQKDASLISGVMTPTMAGYSSVHLLSLSPFSLFSCSFVPSLRC